MSPGRLTYRCEWCRGEVPEPIEHVGPPVDGLRGWCPACRQTVTVIEHREPQQ